MPRFGLDTSLLHNTYNLACRELRQDAVTRIDIACGANQHTITVASRHAVAAGQYRQRAERFKLRRQRCDAIAGSGQPAADGPVRLLVEIVKAPGKVVNQR